MVTEKDGRVAEWDWLCLMISQASLCFFYINI